MLIDGYTRSRETAALPTGPEIDERFQVCQRPVLVSMNHRACQASETLVPFTVNGSQMYGDVPRLDGIHRSPMNMNVVPWLPVTGSTYVVCELNVLLPLGANSFHVAQPLDSEAEVLYSLSLVFQPVRWEPST